MGWFNYIGLIFVVVMMIPNIIFAIKVKGNFSGTYHNRVVETAEQISRFGTFGTMIFNIPYTYKGFWFADALIVYIIVGVVLLGAYGFGWIAYQRLKPIFRACVLSITPCVLFLFCGVMVVSILLMVFSVIFAATHITISLKNALAEQDSV